MNYVDILIFSYYLSYVVSLSSFVHIILISGIYLGFKNIHYILSCVFKS